uniref:Obtusifoliol 14-alpha demethylase n=1 Tax=Oryza punctata TaxID=4537 RepID=A0A0E0JUL1_ORYPU
MHDQSIILISLHRPACFNQGLVAMDLTLTISSVAAACLSIAVLFVTSKMIQRRRRLSKEEASVLPPVVSLVSLTAYLPTLIAKGLPAVIHDLHARLGSVFTVSLLGLKKVTLLVGPEVTAHFFQASESEIRQSNIYKITVPVFGRGVLYDVDLATRSRQISFCTDSIKPINLRGHVDSMVQEVEDYFAEWGQHGVVDIKYEMGKLILLIANRCLLGKQFRESMLEQVSTLVHELFDNGFHLISLFLPYLPTPQHRRRDKARAMLGEMIHEAVRSRRNSGVAEDDVLQKFLDSKYINGRCMTENEIAGLLICMMFAAQHTSSSTSTWTGACLLSHGHRSYLEAAIEEQKRIIQQHGERINWGILLEMTTLTHCIKEALRLHPPANLLIRHASKKFSVQTRQGHRYEIPKGHTLATCTTVSNRLPYIYKDPDVFDPSRFAPGREEDKVGGKFSYTPFSAGRHVCLGEDFAYTQIKVIWSHLLRNFDLELISPFPEEEWEKFIPGPKGKVMVRYKRRRLL